MCKNSGASCSKLTNKPLVNNLLKFQMAVHVLQIHCYFLLRKYESSLLCVTKISITGPVHFLQNFQTILVHSHSRVVQQVLREAAYSKKRFKVYVTESRPNNSG